MAIVKTSSVGPDRFETCPECDTGLSRLAVGGVGDWQTRIQCLDCFKVFEGVDKLTIARLVAKKFGLTLDEAKQANALAQEDYERMLAGGEPAHSPPDPPSARHIWIRRNMAGGEV